MSHRTGDIITILSIYLLNSVTCWGLPRRVGGREKKTELRCSVLPLEDGIQSRLNSDHNLGGG